MKIVLLEEISECVYGSDLHDIVFILIVNRCLKVSGQDRVAPDFTASLAAFASRGPVFSTSTLEPECSLIEQRHRAALVLVELGRFAFSNNPWSLTLLSWRPCMRFYLIK